MKKETLDLIYWVAGIIIGSGLIEISPLKLNPWTWLLTPLRQALTGKLTENLKTVESKVDKVQSDLNDHIAASQEETAGVARQRILRFNDEILQKQKHTKEHFDEILSDIDFYEDYCTDHPKYPNNKAALAIKNIKNVYDLCQQQNGFLTLGDEIVTVRKRKLDETGY